MGHWGKGPFDNDAAGDALDGPVASLANTLQLLRDSDRYDEPRAALAALTALYDAGLHVGVDVFYDGETVLENMLGDKEWLSGWRPNNVAIKRQLNKELKKTQAILKKQQRALRRRRR